MIFDTALFGTLIVSSVVLAVLLYLVSKITIAAHRTDSSQAYSTGWKTVVFVIACLVLTILGAVGVGYIMFSPYGRAASTMLGE